MTIEAMHEIWWKAVKPKHCPEVQRVEMRRAFYGGVTALLIEIKKIGESDVSEDAGVLRLEMWQHELKEFMDRLNRGLE